jgi:hypothetical protein
MANTLAYYRFVKLTAAENFAAPSLVWTEGPPGDHSWGQYYKTFYGCKKS